MHLCLLEVGSSHFFVCCFISRLSACLSGPCPKAIHVETLLRTQRVQKSLLVLRRRSHAWRQRQKQKRLCHRARWGALRPTNSLRKRKTWRFRSQESRRRLPHQTWKVLKKGDAVTRKRHITDAAGAQSSLHLVPRVQGQQIPRPPLSVSRQRSTSSAGSAGAGSEPALRPVRNMSIGT